MRLSKKRPHFFCFKLNFIPCFLGQKLSRSLHPRKTKRPPCQSTAGSGSAGELLDEQSQEPQALVAPRQTKNHHVSFRMPEASHVYRKGTVERNSPPEGAYLRAPRHFYSRSFKRIIKPNLKTAKLSNLGVGTSTPGGTL